MKTPKPRSTRTDVYFALSSLKLSPLRRDGFVPGAAGDPARQRVVPLCGVPGSWRLPLLPFTHRLDRFSQETLPWFVPYPRKLLSPYIINILCLYSYMNVLE